MTSIFFRKKTFGPAIFFIWKTSPWTHEYFSETGKPCIDFEVIFLTYLNEHLNENYNIRVELNYTWYHARVQMSNLPSQYVKSALDTRLTDVKKYRGIAAAATPCNFGKNHSMISGWGLVKSKKDDAANIGIFYNKTHCNLFPTAEYKASGFPRCICSAPLLKASYIFH